MKFFRRYFLRFSPLFLYLVFSEFLFEVIPAFHLSSLFELEGAALLVLVVLRYQIVIQKS